MTGKLDGRGLLFSLRRTVALARYGQRKRQRFRRNFPTVYRLPSTLISEDISRFKDIEPAFSGPELIDKLVTQRSETLESARRWSFVSLLLTAYLLLASFSIELSVSIEGISLASTPGIREVSVLLIAMIGLMLLPRALNVYQVGMAIAGLSKAYYPPELAPFLHSAYFPSEPPSPYYTRMQPELVWNTWFRSFVFASGIFWYAFGIATLILIIWARVTIYVFVWTNPTIDPLITKAIVGLAAAIDASWLSVQILHMLPVPMTNWARLHELQIADDIGSPEATKLSGALYGDDSRDYLDMQRRGYLPLDQQAEEPGAPPPADVRKQSVHIAGVIDASAYLRAIRASNMGTSSWRAIMRARPDLSGNLDRDV